MAETALLEPKASMVEEAAVVKDGKEIMACAHAYNLSER